jgi:cell shape-determining protein MreD
MQRRSWIFLIVLHAVLILTAYVFQGMIFPYVRIFGLIPLLLPIVSTGIAVYEGCHAGGIAGLFSGILCDASFNQPMGTFTVLLTLTGLIIGALVDSVIMRGFVTYILACLVVLVISAIVQIMPHLLFSENLPQSATVAMFGLAIRQTLFSLLFAIPIWFSVRALGRRMQEISTRERPL